MSGKSTWNSVSFEMSVEFIAKLNVYFERLFKTKLSAIIELTTNASVFVELVDRLNESSGNEYAIPSSKTVGLSKLNTILNENPASL